MRTDSSTLRLARLALVASAALALALLEASCGDAAPPASPNAFDRPEAIAFFCWDLNAELPVALDECAPREIASDEEDVAAPRDGFALHALVTQTTTGEVAAVRLTGDQNTAPGVIDSDVRVPGFTFVAAGEVPSGLVVSRDDPKHVFVVSRGSAEIHVVEIAAFRKGLGVAVRVFDEILPTGSRPSAVSLVERDGRPDVLVIALPTRGQLAFVEIVGDGELGAPTFVDLGALVPEPVDLRGLPPEALPPTYSFECQTDPPVTQPPLVGPRLPVSLGAAPEPWSLLIDPLTGELLVADRALPIIHRVDPETMLEGTPLSVSVPTRALALTPFVPATSSTDPAALTPTERYLYAIDEIDRTVLAVDISDEARPTFGAVLPVNVSAPIDRLAAPLPARALAVVTPTYDPSALSFCTDAQQGALASAVSLHGVFLAVGTVDGRIRFFDIYDLDTPCRGVACAIVGANPNPDDQLVAIGRHRPRLGTVLERGVEVVPAPVWSLPGAALTVEEDGSTSQPERIPPLLPVACDPPLAQVYPEDAQTLVCAVTDPWAAVNQSFSAAWQAAIPGTTTSGANIGASGDVFETRSDFCALGVIGSMDVPAGEGPLAGYPGDVVAITADLPPSILMGDQATLTMCEGLTQRSATGASTPILLPILRASTPDDITDTYAGRLEVGDPIVPAGGTFEQVRICFPELLEIEVRVRDSFLVSSGRRGFRHPITRAEDGACVVDPARFEALERGRAFCGQTFRTPELTFALGPCVPAAIDPSASLELVIGEVPLPLTVDVSSIGGSNRASLLETLVYNDVDERLYAIDQSVQGLLRIRLTSLNVQQTFR